MAPKLKLLMLVLVAGCAGPGDGGKASLIWGTAPPASGATFEEEKACRERSRAAQTPNAVPSVLPAKIMLGIVLFPIALAGGAHTAGSMVDGIHQSGETDSQLRSRILHACIEAAKAERQYGAKNPNILQAFLAFGNAFGDAGDFAEAVSVYRRAAEVSDDGLGENKAWLEMLLAQYVRTLRRLERQEEIPALCSRLEALQGEPCEK